MLALHQQPWDFLRRWVKAAMNSFYEGRVPLRLHLHGGAAPHWLLLPQVEALDGSSYVRARTSWLRRFQNYFKSQNR